MSESEAPIDRRDFLRGSLAAAAGAVGVPMAARCETAGSSLAASPQEEADAFLARFVDGWLPLQTAAEEANWSASTDVSEAHTAAQVARNLELNRYVGAPEVIATVRRLLEHSRAGSGDLRPALNDLTARQLEKIRLRAAEAPGTIPEVVKARAEAEARQAATQDGFAFRIRRADQETPASANDIDRILVESRDLGERRAAWEASKAIGRPLRDGLLRLRDLRNKVAQTMGFDDFFALQVADYGMTVPEMLALCDRIIAEVKPLYQQLHVWARHALAKRYQAEVPKDGKLPAHWLPNRWGQNWPGLVEGVDMDAPFKGKPREFITEQAERFYISLGFPPLPKSFWDKSDLYPADPKSGRKKNSHASAWHVNLREDVRSLMSIEPDSRWFNTAHHELGHIYYYISYSTPAVPSLLRAGANRAFHEGVGDLIGLAAGQRPYLKQVGLLTPAAEKAEAVTFLLDTALDGSSVVFLPWSAGVMTRFEHNFYAGKVSDGALNAAWWTLAGQYQGIAPPGERPETLCDAATKTHINDDPAQYYDYAIGTVIKFQLHDHIAREILKQDPRECNYYGDKWVGEFLRGILAPGATKDWNAVLRQATGEGLSARALVAYFAPLADWLARENQGRTVCWT
jgi:peptidyl-dipeptidase A